MYIYTYNGGKKINKKKENSSSVSIETLKNVRGHRKSLRFTLYVRIHNANSENMFYFWK